MARSLAPLFLVAAIVFSPAAHALDAAEPDRARGHLTAFACETLSAPLKVQVQLMDNAERNLRIKDLFVQRLAANGAQVADGAPLVVSLEIDVLRQATRHKPGDLIEARVGRDEPDIGQEGFAKVRMNVWSSTRDSLLNGRQDRIEEEGFDLLRLRARLNSKQDGRCLWQGEIVHDLNGEDPYNEAGRLVPLLVDAIGKPASRQPIHDD